MSAPLIGLVGRKRVGKDTIASRLVDKHGFRRFAFADLLREAALGLDPIVVPAEPAWLSYRLSEIVARDGWEVAKELPEVRRTLQNYGVAIRQVDPDFWIRPVMSAVATRNSPAVITDVRFPNEADAVEAAGGLLVRVIRPGLDESDAHESEVALKDRATAFTIRNIRSIEHMFERSDRLFEALITT
ncbi:hypothetical protein [Actinoplanes philippinensis]|uniref:deoxynucleotide monophosphate kinase family protein n=1 Tax=Actinoplanes philippinensis TaxID=35752 RepID=UPI0033F9E8F1